MLSRSPGRPPNAAIGWRNILRSASTSRSSRSAEPPRSARSPSTWSARWRGDKEETMIRWLSLVCAFAMLGGGAAAQTPKVRLILDFSLQGHHAPFFLAVEGGYFARAGVEVEVDRGYGSGDAVTKVASGAYDMALADLGAMVQFAGRQGEGKVIDVFQVYNVAPMVIMSLRKSGIKRPADL